MTTAQQIPPVLQVDAVAALLDCSPDTVRERAEELRGVKFGRDWVFPAEAFLAALNDIARQPRPGRRAAPRAVVQQLPARRAPPKLPT